MQPAQVAGRQGVSHPAPDQRQKAEQREVVRSDPARNARRQPEQEPLLRIARDPQLASRLGVFAHGTKIGTTSARVLRAGQVSSKEVPRRRASSLGNNPHAMVEFGPYRVDTPRRVVWKGDELLPI